jgi:hypothetical protein
MLSLIKKLFAKKEESTAAPWPFPTGKVSVKPTAEPAPEVKTEAVAPVVEVAVEVAVEGVGAVAIPAEAPTKKAKAKSTGVAKPKVAAKSAPRKPRKPQAQ